MLFSYGYEKLMFLNLLVCLQCFVFLFLFSPVYPLRTHICFQKAKFCYEMVNVLFRESHWAVNVTP